MTILGVNHLKKLTENSWDTNFIPIGDNNVVKPMVILDETIQKEPPIIEPLYKEPPQLVQEPHNEHQ